MNFSGTERLSVIPYKEWLDRKERNPVFRVAKLARSIGGVIKENPKLSVINAVLGGLAFYLGYLAFQVNSEFNERFGTKQSGSLTNLILPKEAALIELLSTRNDGFRTVLTTEETRIQVSNNEGMNVRDYPSKKIGNIILNSRGEPRGEMYIRQLMDGNFSNFIDEWDEQNPNQLNKIWAVRWVNNGENNRGIGHPEFVAVFDRNDGGCLVIFTNPSSKLC